jgi:hypothetical protein
MTRWILAMAAILVLCASASFGQGFTAPIYYPPDYGALPLTTVCNGAIPLPDGRIVKIFKDRNPVGPDPTDRQPTVCNNPPLCEDGPYGTVNYNQFLVNGEALNMGAGYFYSQPPFSSAFGLPAGRQDWYIRVYDADGETVLWTSAMFQLNTGYQTINLSESMTCGQGGAQCQVINESE